MLSSQFRCDRAKAGGEDVVSNLRNYSVAVGSHDFEIGPPLRKCPVALGNAMQAYARFVATNRQSALYYLQSPICDNSIMCGRYRLSRRKQLVEEYFGAVSEDDDWIPRYNIAPSQPVVTIRQDAREPVRRHSTMRWGLIPSWAKDPSIGYKTINARAETVETTASFRDPFRSQRCLIPADGFYEWKKEGKTKQPYCFEVGDGELFAFAGLWDRWTGPQGEFIESCTILTTTPNSLLANFHDRMPVILGPDNHDLWLDPAFRNTTSVSEMLRPFESTMMRSYPVSTRVNQVQNDDVDCAKLLEPGASAAQPQLF